MNERIRELAAVARHYTKDTVLHLERVHNRDYSFEEINEIFDAKFAESIINECITQCSKVLVEHTGQPSVTHNYAVGLCQDSIKEHFMVEV